MAELFPIWSLRVLQRVSSFRYLIVFRTDQLIVFSLSLLVHPFCHRPPAIFRDSLPPSASHPHRCTAPVNHPQRREEQTTEEGGAHLRQEEEGHRCRCVQAGQWLDQGERQTAGLGAAGTAEAQAVRADSDPGQREVSALRLRSLAVQ